MVRARWQRSHLGVVAPADEDPERDDIEVIEISDGEYQQAVAEGLREVGLTYAQLREQARKGDFDSGQARRLWLAIGSADCA